MGARRSHDFILSVALNRFISCVISIIFSGLVEYISLACFFFMESDYDIGLPFLVVFLVFYLSFFDDFIVFVRLGHSSSMSFREALFLLFP